MTSLLAIDAATEACSVALLHQGECLEDFRLEPRSHTRLILPMIDAMLARAGIVLRDLDAIVFSAGPGSFTGLRVASATVQGLAFAADIPVIPVSTLQLLAQCGATRFNLANEGCLLPCMDARMSEVYWGLYQIENGLAVPVMDDQLCSPGRLAVLESAKAPFFGVGDGWQFRHQFTVSPQPSDIDESLYPNAVGLLPLAVARLNCGSVVSADEAQPRYLRDSVAWQK